MFDIVHYSERNSLYLGGSLSRSERRRTLGDSVARRRSYAKYTYRSRSRENSTFAPLDFLFVQRRRQLAIAHTQPMASENSAVTAEVLGGVVPAGLRRRVRRLYRFARRTQNPLHGAFAGRAGRKYRRGRQTPRTDLTDYLDQTSRYFGRRFVEQVAEVSPVVPLTFQHPTVRVVKTELAKRREFAASVVRRESRFKFTAQYVDSITKYIPALITQMFSNKIKNSKFAPTPYQTARYLVRNMY